MDFDYCFQELHLCRYDVQFNVFIDESRHVAGFFFAKALLREYRGTKGSGRYIIPFMYFSFSCYVKPQEISTYETGTSCSFNFEQGKIYL